MKKQEKKQVQELISMLENWREDGVMVRATKTYKLWQHDKNSYAYGWLMGIDSVLQKLYELK